MPLSTLNLEQKEAAICEYGNNLVIASAGTGKTSTIVGRISHLLNSGVKPKEILLLTFTNKAASEMVSRVAKIFSEDIAKEIRAGTFHSISFKLLKELNIDITLKQPNDLKTLFKSIYEKRVFTTISEEATPYDGGYLYDLYSLYLNANNNEDFITWIKDKSPAHELYTLIYEDVIEEFNTLKKEFGYVNFDDLLTNMIEELKDNFFEFKEILVDEYQDTNPLQGRLLDAFKPKSLFCVGDYDQSIYAFNGSDIKIISNFSNKYEDSKVFTLKKNYRSTKAILDLATKVIEYNDRIYPKKLEVVRQDSNTLPKLLVFDELFSQYEYIAKLISQTTTSYNDIAIIYRNNSSADGVEANLREQGIPAKRKGGVSFFDSIEIKYILDVLTLQVNSSDMMAFIHILEYGKGIGKAIAKDIFEALLKLGEKDAVKGLLEPLHSINNPFETKRSSHQLGLFDDFIDIGSVAKFKDCNFDEAFFANPILKHPKLSIDGAKYIYDVYILFKQLKRVKSPTNLISSIGSSLAYTRIKEHLCTRRATQKDGTINEMTKIKANARINQKVELLRNLSRNYKDLYRFLNAMVLGRGELSEGDGVNLLSIHASKGLEFKEVYVIDLMDGRFPNRKLMSKGGSIEEERRLFYVAVTRAKDILYLSYAKYDKIKKMNFIASPFLKEAGMIVDNTKDEDI